MSIGEINADEEAIAELAIANVRFGAEQERERIIKLLNERLYPIYYPKSIAAGGGEAELVTEIIALIKGKAE